MDSIFKICKKGQCGITISGLEKDNDEYLSEDGEIIVSTRNYAYSQTITLNAITSITSEGNEKIEVVSLVEHLSDCIDESDVEFPVDGLYEVTHIILPTDKWLAYVLEREPTALDAYSLVYIYHTETQQYMKYINETLEVIDVEEIMAANALPPATVTDKATTIIRSDKNTFCMCYINDCFNTLCKNLLDNLPKRCPNKLDNYHNQIFNRDIIWMAINVIKYLIELQRFHEAQRILENVTHCGGICNQKKLSNSISGCGCNS